MKSKNELKRKKRKRQQKSNIEKKNLNKIEEIKEEDKAKRTQKKVKKAAERSNKNKLETNNTSENLNAKKKSKNEKTIKLLKTLFIIMVVISCVVIAILLYLAFKPKFKDITIELGTTDITAYDFLVSDIYKNGVEAITDLSSLELNSVKEIDVVLSFKGKEETVKLNIVDTTAPTVVFKNAHGYLDYILNPDDFIESKEDYSEMTVEIVNEVQFSDYGTYPVTIKVSDVYGNETIGECELMITWLYSDVTVELGSEFSVANVVIDVERFGSLVAESELAKVNTMAIGTYELYVDIDGKTYTSTVVVQDTTPPDLQLQNLTIWNDQTIAGYESFIISASDISGEVTTESSTVIDYSIIGDQNIVIKATDINGNVSEQTAVLTIKTDTTGPVIYGLSNLTVNKYSSIDYASGVYAIDDKDGSTTFTADSSSVNVSVAGTYYANYSSTDAAGNTSTYKRKIIVNWDADDVNEKIDSFYNSYCAGLSADGITSVVNSRIKYKAVSYSDRNSNIYYGLTNGSGNCIIHAYILQAMLNKAGYSCQIVRTSDGAHYWNVANGIHYDSTGGTHLLVANSNEEKASEPYMVSHGYTVDNFIF